MTLEPANSLNRPPIPSPGVLPLAEKIRRLQGPILVLGASGFVGANLLRSIAAVRRDVVGTTSSRPAWRLEDLAEEHVRTLDLLIDTNLDALLDDVRPRTVFNCVAYGAYSFEVDSQLIYRTNFHFLTRLVTRLAGSPLACFVQAGSSSEYGDNAAGPAEDDPTVPNSDYAVSKVSAASLMQYYGKRKRLPCANLRLYSVYGPFEDASRLIPMVIRRGLEGGYPEFVNPAVSRDFVYVDDVTEAFVDTALNLVPADFGESFNIGTGRQTTIGEVAATAHELFQLADAPAFTMPERAWDVHAWFANPAKARTRLGWEARTPFRDGLERMIAWYQTLPDPEQYYHASKKFGLDTVYSVSAVVFCANAAASLPAVYERLKAVFVRLNVEFEIVFVDDGSTDDTQEVLRGLSRSDRRVLGVVHSRPFGSQAAYRSGMEVATRNACVLIDANLHDPPELIEEFVAGWRQGNDVVYGQRLRDFDGPLTRAATRAFYRVFNAFSSVPIPPNAGDFCLIDRRVVGAILGFPERNLFLRGVRAYAGFRQVGVPYEPDPAASARRRTGLLQNLRRAKNGILSFTNVPMTVLSDLGIVLLTLSVVLGLFQIAARVFLPDRSASGITTVILFILFFGALNAFALGMIGEYVGKIFEEVKRRPHFIRRVIVRDGEIRRVAEATTRGG